MYKILSFLLMISFIACTKTTKVNQNSTRSEEINDTENFSFSADSAFRFIQEQVDFGPRVPNTPNHLACSEYLVNKLKSYNASVVVQKADLTAFDGTILHAKNIIASYNLDVENRILLFAHWDTRPWADNDKNVKNHQKPILGANDGASGVGVLLELARQFNLKSPEVGVDIILFDAEDYGTPSFLATAENGDFWCLGSQYWSKNKHIPNYRAKYGILLDMVGGTNATFYREQVSDYFAKHVVDKVWNKANKLGFSDYFINKIGGTITDDHLYVNKIAGIPSIDIIQYDPHSETGFGAFWHTQNDTMDSIDKNTLHAVGTTLVHLIYSEKP